MSDIWHVLDNFRRYMGNKPRVCIGCTKNIEQGDRVRIVYYDFDSFLFCEKCWDYFNENIYRFNYFMTLNCWTCKSQL